MAAAASGDYFTGDELEAIHFIIEQDFLDDTEFEVIPKENGFNCDLCNKYYKTEGGFRRHNQTKHGEMMKPPQTTTTPLPSEYFDQQVIKELVEKSAKKLVEESLYPETIVSELREYVLNIEDANYIYYNFLKQVIANNIKDNEKFYPTFYKIFSKNHIFTSLSKQASTLVGFELANQLLHSFLTRCEEEGRDSNTNSIKNSTDILTEKENSVIAYISGYVLSTFYRRIRKSDSSNSDIHQKQLALLKAGKIENPEKDELIFNQLIDSYNRGGLWHVNSDVLNIFTITEKLFRIEVHGRHITSIDSNKIVENVINDNTVLSHLSNIQEVATITVDQEDAVNFLEQLILLYVRVRSHSYAKEKIEQHKVENKIKKSRSLRTEIKRASEMN